jgi:DNA repair exonuclease SbcCD ATPase subunit
MSYKFSLLTTAGLSRRIGKKADELNRIISPVEDIHKDLSERFEQLKKVKPKLNKLKVQAAEFKEEKPRLQDLYEQHEKEIRGIEERLASDIDGMLSYIGRAVLLMRDIIFYADTIIYRENKRFSSLILRARKMADAVAANRAAFRLNTIKAEMKSLTLRLLQASELEEEELLSYPAKKFEMEKTGIKKFGSEIAELEEEGVGMLKVDLIISNSMKKLKDLRAIEMRVIFLMTSADRYFDYLKSKAYLFEDDIREDVEKKILASAKTFEDIKKDIREQALELYGDIEIIGEK